MVEATEVDSNGKNSESGPDANSSGFGGLWVDGMVGTDDSDEAGTTPPGEGKSGVMSGDNSWKGDRGGRGFFRNGGIAGIVEALESR